MKGKIERVELEDGGIREEGRKDAWRIGEVTGNEI